MARVTPSAIDLPESGAAAVTVTVKCIADPMWNPDATDAHGNKTSTRYPTTFTVIEDGKTVFAVVDALYVLPANIGEDLIRRGKAVMA
jgi:hypothetical protein